MHPELDKAGFQEGDSREPIKFRGVHGEIIKSESQSPKPSHKMVAIVKIPHHCCSVAGLYLGSPTEMTFLSYQLHIH